MRDWMRGLITAYVHIGLAAALAFWTAGCAHRPSAARDPVTPAAVPAPAPTLRRALQHEGLARTYGLYVPARLRPEGQRPLLLVFHGLGGNTGGIEWQTAEGFNRLADREGFLVAYPEGIRDAWNAGPRGPIALLWPSVDDVGFTAAVIEALDQEFDVDRRRVYATGFSNGAFMCHRLALEMPDRIAAIAPVGGTLLPGIAAGDLPGRPVPACIIHGTSDCVVQWCGLGVGRHIIYHSVDDTVSFWVRRNGCAIIPREEALPDADPKDGTRVIRKTYASPWGRGDVVVYRVEGGGHEWPGGRPVAPESFRQRLSRDVNACEAIWEFLKRRSLPPRTS